MHALRAQQGAPDMTRALQHAYPHWVDLDPYFPSADGGREVFDGHMRIVRNARRAKLLRRRGVPLMTMAGDVARDGSPARKYWAWFETDESYTRRMSKRKCGFELFVSPLQADFAKIEASMWTRGPNLVELFGMPPYAVECALPTGAGKATLCVVDEATTTKAEARIMAENLRKHGYHIAVLPPTAEAEALRHSPRVELWYNVAPPPLTPEQILEDVQAVFGKMLAGQGPTMHTFGAPSYKLQPHDLAEYFGGPIKPGEVEHAQRVLGVAEWKCPHGDNCDVCI